jgi:small multidrug resistance pump
LHWLLLGAAIVFETIATSALKASDGMTRTAPTLLVIVAYALSFWLLAQVLRVVPVGIAYAIWSGVGICLIAAIGWTVFGQRLDTPALLGMSLIVAGILVIKVFSNQV